MERDRLGATGSNIKCRPGDEETLNEGTVEKMTS